MKETSTKHGPIVAVFQERTQAEQAVAELKRAGFRDSDIGLISKENQGDAGRKTATGAATGAAAGAGVAALASLGMTFGVIPVIGPILAVGPLGAALLSAVGGAAAGGLVGALVGLGVSEDAAKYYQSEISAGRTLVTVKADGRASEAWTILQRFHAYNFEHRRTADTATGTSATAAPRTPATSTPGAPVAGTAAGERTMQLHEEQLHAHKQPVETGEARVRKEVVTEHKTLDVPVHHEEVVVERHPGSGQPAASGDIHAGEELRIPVHAEQVRVEKTPVVKEEVTVGKRLVQDTEHVGGTVRKEEARVEKKGDVDIATEGKAKDAERRDKGR